MDDMPQNVADMLERFEQSIVPTELREKGWRYVDPPTKFSHEMWDYFLRLIGDGEYQVIAFSQGVASDGFEWKRGQLLVSPQGMNNIADKGRRAALMSVDP